MAVDSTLSIVLLLALATDPELSKESAESLNNAFFPWICGIQKILDGYLSYNDDLAAKRMNYSFYYSNLKEYEDRTIYFIHKALSQKSAYKSKLKAYIKIMLSVYITTPEANHGMNSITNKALYHAGGKGMALYKFSLNLIRHKKLL